MSVSPTIPADSTANPDAEGGALMDVGQVAELLRCSARHVYRLRDGGLMPPALKVGSLVRWSRQAIEAWIDGGCKPVRRRERV